MDNLDSPTPSPAPMEKMDTESAFDSLRYVIHATLVLAIILAGSFDLFLLRQVKYLRADVKTMKPQVEAVVAEYNKTTAPVLNEFAKRLVEFGQKNPDFMPILVKYGITKPTGPTGAAPATAKSPVPVTAPAPAPKK